MSTLLLNSYVELTFFLKDNKNLLTFWLNGPKVTAYYLCLAHMSEAGVEQK